MVINLRRAYYLLYIIYYAEVCYHQSMFTVVVKRIYILFPVYSIVVFFTLTDRASTIPSNIRGCQSGTWSAGQKNIRGTSTKKVQ